MATDTYVYEGGVAWRKWADPYVHEQGGTHRDIVRSYVHAGGGTWRRHFDVVPTPTLGSVYRQRLNYDSLSSTCQQAGGGKNEFCGACVGWDSTDCNNSFHHIQIAAEVNGGSYVQVQDNYTCGGCGGFCQACTSTCVSGSYRYVDTTCRNSTESVKWRVRIEEDTTHVVLAASSGTAMTGCPGCVV
jgi:hypothetical protein